MDSINGFPYSAAVFDKTGKLLTSPTVPAGTTDLIVVSHGWNNDRTSAEKLYSKLYANFAAVTAGDPLIQARKVAIVGVIWPSRKWDDFIKSPAAAQAATGGARSSAAASKAASLAAMQASIDLVAPLFDAPGDDQLLARLRQLVPDLADDPAAQSAFVEVLRQLLDPDQSQSDQQSSDDGSAVFFRGPAEVIFSRAAQTVVSPSPAPAASTSALDGTGQAAGLGAVVSGPVNAVASLLNLTTYFQMKQMAGTVGQVGLAPLIDKLAPQVERVHLAGHSFGGRLVTAAAASSTTPKLHGLALLQAAFSHHGFSKKRKGFFRSVVKDQRLHGPILVTHTKNDLAVGLAYPAASRISRDNASAFGGPDDEFGGIGSNGAQQLEDGELVSGTNRLLAVGKPYVWQAGKFHNLESSPFIRNPEGGDAHGFIFVPEVAWAISRALLA